MKIKIERSGGFAGIKRTITIDTKNLPKDMADTLVDCLSEAIKFKQPFKKIKDIVPDCYSYKISAQTARKEQELEFRELSVDKKLKSVIDFIFKNYPKCSCKKTKRNS